MSRRVYLLRILLVFGLFVGVFAALLRHIYRVQVVRHDELSARARETYMTSRRQVGQRGAILDRSGNLLVGNIACKDILAEPRRMPENRRDYIKSCLVDVLGVDREALDERFASDRVEVVVARGVPMEQADALAELRLPGVRGVDRQQRYHPKGALLANVLGFTDDQGHGAYGIEQAWDEILAPNEGDVVYERDRKGRRLHRSRPEGILQLDGSSVMLTIDEPLQSLVEKELAALYDEHQPKRCFAIMAEPRTGAILAFAQYPSFDPNNRDEMDPELWRNHLISDVFDPGSVMKGVSIGAALDYGLVNLATVFDCEDGRWFYGGKVLRDSHPYGRMPVAGIVQKSSNIGTAKIALEMGEVRLYQAFRRFGFGEATGLGLKPESRGILRPVGKWDKLSITRFPIGQGVSVTAPQLVQAYCALANEGQLPQLHLVCRIVGADGEVTDLTPPPRHRALRPPAARLIRHALSLVVTDEGTGRRAQVAGYQVAGKTGTAQKCIDGTYEGHDKYVASFVGFVPARDPAFVLLVSADEPGAKYHTGGTVCGPTWRNIAEEALRYLNVPPVGGDPGVVAANQH